MREPGSEWRGGTAPAAGGPGEQRGRRAATSGAWCPTAEGETGLGQPHGRATNTFWRKEDLKHEEQTDRIWARSGSLAAQTA